MFLSLESIVFILIGINLLVFVLPYLGLLSKQHLVEHYANTPSTIKNGEYYRLITSGFLHNDMLHLFFNMYSLYVLAPAIITLLQIFKTVTIPMFLLLYFFAMLVSSWASSKWTNNYSIGASGAIFGLLGFLLVVSLLTGQSQLLQSLLFIIGLNLVFTFMPGSSLDKWGHVGGLIAGMFFGVALFAIKIIGLL